MTGVTAARPAPAATLGVGEDLLYAFDPLCGWCYGLVPALEHLTAARPDIRIRLVMGGLITGDRIGPYAAKASYIREASARLESVTGQRLGAAFFDRLLADQTVTASSVPPCAALLEVRSRRPDKVLAFAHALQRLHFGEGLDLNDRHTIRLALDAIGCDLDIEPPTPLELPAILAEEFAATRAMGIRSYPTVGIRQGAGLLAIPVDYRPAAFVASVVEAIEASRG